MRMTAKKARQIRARALRDAANKLVWVRPEACPCDTPESCCGSVDSCDAMQPYVRVVGPDTLRVWADQMEAGDFS